MKKQIIEILTKVKSGELSLKEGYHAIFQPTKFKVGDKVRIVSEIDGHGFAIGELVTILKAEPDDYFARGESGEEWWVSDEGAVLVD